MTEVQADLVRRSVPFASGAAGAAPRVAPAESWVKQMQAAGYAPNTINTRMMTVKAALQAALRDRAS